MVTVTNCIESVNSDTNETFISLELSGDPEMVQSQETGRFYLTSRKTIIATTYSVGVAKSLIGKQMPGSIIKQNCEPYNYTIKETGEVIELSHTYLYSPNEAKAPQPNAQITTERPVVAKVESFSKNGIGNKELVMA